MATNTAQSYRPAHGCGVLNSLVSVPIPTPKKKSAASKVATSIVVAIVVVSVIILLAPTLSKFVVQQKDNPAITILQPAEPAA